MRNTSSQGRIKAVTTIPLALTALLLLTFLPPSPAKGNDTYVGSTGGGVYARESKDIRLERETVQAVMYGRFAEYQVDFELRNHGPAQEVDLGFPFTHSGVEGLDLGPAAVLGFRAWHDGTPLEVEVKPQVALPADSSAPDAGLSYYVHSATFPSGISHVTVRYLARPGMSAGTRFQADPGQEGGYFHWYTYWLHTGAGWNGSIGKAVVRHTLADTFLGWDVDIRAAQVDNRWSHGTTYPEGYARPAPRTYQWIYRDFEPGPRDLVLTCYLERETSAKLIAVMRGRLESLPVVSDVRFRPEVPLSELPEGTLPEAIDWWPQLTFTLPPGEDADALLQQMYADDSLPEHEVTYGPGDWGFFPYDVTLAYSGNHYAGAGTGDLGPSVAAITPAAQEGDTSALRDLWVGSRIEFELTGLETVREIRLVPGDLGAEAEALAGPERLRFTFTDGRSAEIVLTTEPAVQHFAVEGGAGRVTMEVLSLHPGAGERASLWEVEFGAEEAPAFEEFADLIRDERGVVDPLAVQTPPAALRLAFEGQDGSPGGGGSASTTLPVPAAVPDESAAEPAGHSGGLPLPAILLLVALAAVGTAAGWLAVLVVRRSGHAHTH